MPKPWKEIAALPEYKSLPLPEKEAWQKEYFRDVVLPNYQDENEQVSAWNDFSDHVKQLDSHYLERALQNTNQAEMVGRAIKKINPFMTEEEEAALRAQSQKEVELAKQTGSTKPLRGIEEETTPLNMAIGIAGVKGLSMLTGAKFIPAKEAIEQFTIAPIPWKGKASVKGGFDKVEYAKAQRAVRQAEKIQGGAPVEGVRYQPEVEKLDLGLNKKMFSDEHRVLNYAQQNNIRMTREELDVAKDAMSMFSQMPPKLQEDISRDGVKAILDASDMYKKPSMVQDLRSQFTKGIDRSVADSSPKAREMVDFIQETNKIGEIRAGEKVADYTNITRGLSKKEKENFYDSLDGTAKPINNRVEVAVSKMRLVDDSVADLAKQAKLTVRRPSVEKWSIQGKTVGQKTKGPWELLDENGELIEKYKTKTEAVSAWKAYKDRPFVARKDHAPRVADLDAIQKRKHEVIAHLINTGQVPKADAAGKIRSLESRVELAKQQLNIFMKRNSERRYGHLQIARELDLPRWAYSHDPDVVFPSYLERSMIRITEAERYGSRDELLKKYIDDIASEGGNAAQAQRMIDLMFRRTGYTPEMDRVVAKILDYQVLTKMALSQVGQIGQFVNAVARTNAMSVLKNVYWRISDPVAAKDFYLRSGSAINQIRLRAIHEATGGTKLAEKFLRASGFIKMDGTSRNWASGAGRFYALHLADKLKRNPKSDFAIRRLRDLDIDPQDVIKNNFNLTNEQMLRAGLKSEIDTNYRNRIIEIPEFASSSWGRLFFQFQSFSFQQSKFIRDYIYKEIRAGNPLPAVYFLAAGQVAGQAINTIRSLVRGEDVEFNVLDNWMAAGTLGMFQLVSSMAQYGSPPLGATVRSAENLAKFIGYAVTGDGMNALKSISKEVPLLKNWMFPREEQ